MTIAVGGVGSAMTSIASSHPGASACFLGGVAMRLLQQGRHRRAFEMEGGPIQAGMCESHGQGTGCTSKAAIEQGLTNLVTGFCRRG